MKKKKNYFRQIIIILIFFVAFLSAVYFVDKKFNFSLQLKNILTIAKVKDTLVKRLYLIDSQYNLFKKEISSQTKGKITFCDKFPETEKAIREINKNDMFGEYNRNDGLISFSSLGPQTAIVLFSYCKNKDSIYDVAYAIMKFESNYSYRIIKVVSENISFSSIGSGQYGEWIKLQKEFGEKNYPSRNFMRASTAKMLQAKIVKNNNFGWSEVYFNPFLLGLNEEKPYKDNEIYFGLYKSKPVLFFTNDYVRYRLKLKENQGIATDFDNVEHYIDFKDVTNQIMLHGVDEQNQYFAIKIREKSDSEYHQSSQFIEESQGNYFIISEEVIYSFSDQYSKDFKAVWINSQPEITNKIIEDYKQYLLEKPRLKNQTS